MHQRGQFIHLRETCLFFEPCHRGNRVLIIVIIEIENSHVIKNTWNLFLSLFDIVEILDSLSLCYFLIHWQNSQKSHKGKQEIWVFLAKLNAELSSRSDKFFEHWHLNLSFYQVFVLNTYFVKLAVDIFTCFQDISEDLFRFIILTC